MRALRHRNKASGWPFFLLVAAWICANSPQSLVSNVVEWAKGARHFSHQQQLRAEVVYLLAGPQMQAVLAASKAPSKAPATFPMPDEAVLKKIDLAAPRNFEVPACCSELCLFVISAECAPDSVRAEPAFLPPRARVES